MKWCNLYECWCSDVEEVVDDEDFVCDLDCKSCEYEEETKIR